MQRIFLLLFLSILISSCGSSNKKSDESGRPINLTDKSFQKKIMESEDLSVVYFWATWCGPCKMTTPVIENLSKEQMENITFAKVNVDKCKKITSNYGVITLPTVLIIKNGEVVDQYVGGFSSSRIREMIRNNS